MVVWSLLVHSLTLATRATTHAHAIQPAIDTHQTPRTHHNILIASDDQPLTPLADQILVELHEEPTVSAGGILMPNAIAEDETAPFQENFEALTPRYGTVVAVGGGRRSVASGAAVGLSI